MKQYPLRNPSAASARASQEKETIPLQDSAKPLNAVTRNRRKFLKYMVTGAAAAIISPRLCADEEVIAKASSAPDRNRPNIVFILADDLGYGDVSCLNPKRGKIPTPNIDRLASQGVVFTDAHSTSSVCSPTRCSLLTGRYNWRSKKQTDVLKPYSRPLISQKRLTLPKLLKENGYHTGCVGKWHLGWDWPSKDGKVIFDQPIANGPTTRGFDYYFGVDAPDYPPYCFIENDRTVGILDVPFK